MTDSTPAADFGPRFAFDTRETLADGTAVYAVTVRHYAAPAPAGDDDDEVPPAPEPIARSLGLVWHSGSAGWSASPPTGSWGESVDRAVRSFPDRDGAAMFLYGFDAAQRWQRYQAALAELPWHRAPAV